MTTIPPARPHTGLPSSMTESQLADALVSDDIDHVKAQLVHAWSHYQSLEFALNSEAAIADQAKRYAAKAGVDDELEFAARLYNVAVVDMAYDAAHLALAVSQGTELSVPDALREVYAGKLTEPEPEPNVVDLSDD